MNSAFRAIKGDDGILSYTGSTFPIAKGKYREHNKIFYRSKQVVTGGTFNSAFWDIIGVTSGNSISVGLLTDGQITGTTSGTTLTLGLSNTGVAANTYNYGRFTVNAKGRITSASSLIAVSAVTGTAGVTGATSGSGSGKLLTVGLSNTAVSPNTYQKATITVDQKGRITFASGNTLLGVNGIGITGNTFGLTRTNVTPGTYQRATITVDERGRITFASGNTSSGGSGTPGGTNGSIQFKIGSSFTGRTNFIFQHTNNAFTIGTRSAGVTGNTSVSIGTSNSPSASNSIAIGTGHTINTNAFFSTAIGRGHTINGNANTTFAAGMGHVIQDGSFSTVFGFKNQASGVGSFAGGYNESAGGARPNLASGLASFIYSYTDTSQSSGHGALANFSTILGGKNNHIASSNIGAAIIGGDTVKLTATTYSYNTIVSNLGIWSTPTNATTQDVLAWDSTTKKVMKVTQDSLSPSFQNVAYVSKNGNNSIAIINNLKKPFLTIQAAISALVAGSSPSASNRCLVEVMTGFYNETVNLASYVDLNLNNSSVLRIQDITSGVVDVNVFGNGIIGGGAGTTAIGISNTNSASRYYIEAHILKGQNLLNNSIVDTKYINAGNNGTAAQMNGQYCYLKCVSMTGITNCQGNGEHYIDVDYHTATVNEPERQGPLQIANFATTYTKLYYKSNKTVGNNCPAIAINWDAGFSGETYVKGNFYSNYSNGVVFVSTGGGDLRGKILLDGYFKSTYVGNTSAMKLRVPSSGVPVKYIIQGGSALIAAGSGTSISNSTGVDTINIRYYGDVFANTSPAGTINPIVGSLIVDADVV